MNFEAAIFDLDGVIVDTAKYHYYAWKKLADEWGIKFCEKDNERLKGVSRLASLNILLDIGHVKLSEQEKLIAADRKNQWYLEYINLISDKDILPGAKDLLLQFKKMGIRIALGSASKNAPLILQRLGIYDLFDAIIDGNMITQAKPDPEIFLLAAEKLGVEPQKCIVFEDSVAGIKAALAGGMFAVGVGDKEILKEATLNVTNLEDYRI